MLLAHAQVLEHLLQPRQHLARGVLGAGARHLARLVEHLLQVAALDAHRVAVHRLHLAGVAPRLLDHRLEHAVDRLLQLLDQLLDLGVGRVVGERVLQPLLDRAQIALGHRQLAVLDAQRGVPQQVLHRIAPDRRGVAHRPHRRGLSAR